MFQCCHWGVGEWFYYRMFLFFQQCCPNCGVTKQYSFKSTKLGPSTMRVVASVNSEIYILKILSYIWEEFIHLQTVSTFTGNPSNLRVQYMDWHSNMKYYTISFLWPALWVSYCKVLLLLQVGEPLRVFYSYFMYGSSCHKSTRLPHSTLKDTLTCSNHSGTVLYISAKPVRRNQHACVDTLNCLQM